MELPVTVAMEQGLLRQNVAMSVIKQSAEQQQAIVKMLDQTLRSAPVSPSRGSNVDLTA